QPFGAIGAAPPLRCAAPAFVTSTNGTPLSNPMTRPLAPSRRLYSAALACIAAGLIQGAQGNAALSRNRSAGEAGKVSVARPARRKPVPICEPSAGWPTLCALLAQAEESSDGVPRSLK